MSETMQAVLLHKVCTALDITISHVPIPTVRPGWVLIQIKAFGLNHSEQLLRLSEIDAPYIQKPIIPGIECVGIVVDPSDSELQKGQKVIALMGGMGRSFNGSYAEYALVPEKNVFTIKTDLPWEYIAAIPETYYTAWGSLFDCLHLTSNDTLLVRGATSALGYAAIQLAKAVGAKVIATTHKKEKLGLLEKADSAILDTGVLEKDTNLTQLRITKALELVGPKTLRDTLKTVTRGGIVCNTGVLGGVYALNGFDPIKEIPNGVYLTGFFSNAPNQKTIDAIFSFLNTHTLQPILGKVFDFSNIQNACIAQDEGRVNGKIVVKVYKSEI